MADTFERTNVSNGQVHEHYSMFATCGSLYPSIYQVETLSKERPFPNPCVQQDYIYKIEIFDKDLNPLASHLSRKDRKVKGMLARYTEMVDKKQIKSVTLSGSTLTILLHEKDTPCHVVKMEYSHDSTNRIYGWSGSDYDRYYQQELELNRYRSHIKQIERATLYGFLQNFFNDEKEHHYVPPLTLNHRTKVTSRDLFEPTHPSIGAASCWSVWGQQGRTIVQKEDIRKRQPPKKIQKQQTRLFSKQVDRQPRPKVKKHH